MLQPCVALQIVVANRPRVGITLTVMRQEALEVSNRPASQVTARLFFVHFSLISFDGMKCQAKILSRKMFLYQ